MIFYQIIGQYLWIKNKTWHSYKGHGAWHCVIVKVDYNTVFITVNFVMSFVGMVFIWETRSLKISLRVETIYN